MRPVYVRNLIELLKYLGWEQRDIAKRLKVSTTAVSLWATGKRPVPHRRTQPLIELILEVLREDHSATIRELEALQVGGNDAPREEQERRLARSEECEAHHRQVWAYIDAWHIELYVTVGKFVEEVQYELEVLGSPYAKFDPLKLPRDERRKLRFACQMLVRHFDYLDQLEMEHPHEDNSAVAAHSKSPTTYLDEVRRWYGIAEED